MIADIGEWRGKKRGKEKEGKKGLGEKDFLNNVHAIRSEFYHSILILPYLCLYRSHFQIVVLKSYSFNI